VWPKVLPRSGIGVDQLASRSAWQQICSISGSVVVIPLDIKFQNPETEPSVFVLSLKAGGVGITLTKANHVFHFDRWWNPSVEDQATDRAFRIGQKKNVFVHKFVTMETLEERIDEMIEDKKKLAGAIVGLDESWLTELDNDAFRELIPLNQSAIME
jgi:SNF2 family DNA or RNA helicase